MLNPLPLPEDRSLRPPTEWVKIFYHGTQAHYEEIHWLYPVMREVLETGPNVRFEIIGNHEVNKLSGLQHRDLTRFHQTAEPLVEGHQRHTICLRGSRNPGIRNIVTAQSVQRTQALE